MKKYAVVSGYMRELKQFEMDVDKLLAVGWELQGGVSTCVLNDGSNQIILSQAVVLPDF